MSAALPQARTPLDADAMSATNLLQPSEEADEDKMKRRSAPGSTTRVLKIKKCVCGQAAPNTADPV